jgi:hypothetical protein
VLSADQAPSLFEQVTNSGMSTQESLCLPNRFELAHPSLPDPGRLMRLLGPIILILLGTVNRLRSQFPMR